MPNYRNCRNDQNLHPAMYKALTRDDYDHEASGDISATSLIKPPRIVQLQKKYGHLVQRDVTHHLWSCLGTAVHLMFEREAEKIDHGTVEKRIGIKMNDWDVTCKTDLFQVVEPGVVDIVDWKVTGTFGYEMAMQEGREGAKEDWEQQLNINS